MYFKNFGLVALCGIFGVLNATPLCPKTTSSTEGRLPDRPLPASVLEDSLKEI